MRRGVSLVELVVAMAVFGIVFGLVAQAMRFQQRWQRQLQSASAASRAARQATAILAAAIGDAAAADLLGAQSSDSAIELMAPVASGVACVAAAELSTVAPDDTGGASRAAYAATPRAGDRVLVFDAGVRPPRWHMRSVVDLVPAVQPCTVAGTPPLGGITLLLDSALDAPPFAAFRLQRRTRYDLYRGGDGDWYLGMREWNPQARAFNSVQPVAGPLRAFSANAERTGLRFAYFDSAGRPAVVPPDSLRVRRVTITARAADTTAGVSQRSVVLHRVP